MSWLGTVRTRWLIAGGAVVVAAVVVGVVLLLRDPPPPDPSTPEFVAYTTAQALSSKDIEKLRGVSCDPGNLDGDVAANAAAVLEQPSVTVSARAGGDPVVRGDKATAKLDVKITDQGGTQDVPVTLQLTRRGTGWCLADLT